jgi:hypothetical protein
LPVSPNLCMEPEELRKVLECGSPLPPWKTRHARERQGTAALQDAVAPSQVHGRDARLEAVGAFQEQAPVLVVVEIRLSPVVSDPD